ncbi:MAG: ABC transporter permease [bacterium]
MSSARQLGTASLLSTLIGVQLRQLLMQRKTRALAVVQLLPVVGALVYVLFENVDGLTMFSGVAEQLLLPFLVPLAAIFYGGPAIVDEMEGRTLTYLTLRPISKATLFLGKVFAGTLVALLLVLIPTLLLFGICMFQAMDFSESLPVLGRVVGAATLGTVVYSAIFAALGAMFASSLLASILYFVASEMVLATLPVLELLSIRFHLRIVAGFLTSDRLGFLDRMVLDKPLQVEWWVSLMALCLVTAIAWAGGAVVFKEKQYLV